MQDFEKLGAFYLGRQYDLSRKQGSDAPLLYDSQDLVTHAVCVGMTGSGKTGLCIDLIEEAAIDGIPSILIDPKGDLANLLLTFPDLQPQDFEPWINADDARNKGLSPADYAAQQAAAWKQGLARWGEDGQRIRKLKESADFAIYTPGSRAGLPVSILSSFAAPGQAITEDREILRERVASTATSVLGLLGIEADPLKSREHILLSTILNRAWCEGQDLDLPTIIQQIQSPPVSRIGVLDLDSFFPAKERFELAMQLNNLLASPGFETWLEGEPLDAGRLLHTPEGRPRVSILSIAHLSDAERMFFVSLLLTQVLSWMRTQPGTTSLRAILYMDEIFGYFPPVANPPSKLPLLTLLKQGRAFGLGVVLATQNPVDLDYKGLSNAGTWFIGRLQTERDKARVLDGLEGAAAAASASFDRHTADQTISALGSRIFLMNNVHEDVPEVFETRWSLSYLRGPLTRNEIRTLMAAKEPAATPARNATRSAAEPAQKPARIEPLQAGSSSRPVLPPEIPQQFVPVREAGAKVVYKPMVLGAARLRFADAKLGVDQTREVVFVTAISDGAVAVNWADSQALDVPVSDLEREGAPGAAYGEVPAPASKSKNYAAWSRDFSTFLYQTQKLTLLRSPSMRELSRPEETERDFRIRLQQAAREARDAEVEKLKKKYAPQIAALDERLRKAQQAVDREADQKRQQQMQTALSVGTTLLSAFLGRKALSMGTLGRATTAARSAGRMSKEGEDVERAMENVESMKQQRAALDEQFRADTAALEARIDAATEPLENVEVRLKKSDISVQLVALAWVP
jgi:hypothetical protein